MPTTGGPPTGFSAVAQFTSASYTFQPQLVSASQSLGGIWDNGAGNVNITANSNYALSLAGTTTSAGHTDTGVELDYGAGSLTINCPVTMTAAQVWYNNSSNPVTINGTLNWGGFNSTMNISSSGVVVLAGSVGNIGTGNTYLGNVTITGTVAAGQTQFIGDANTLSSGTTTVAPGGFLNLQTGENYLAVVNYLIVNGGTIQNVGTKTNTTIDMGWVTGYAGA